MNELIGKGEKKVIAFMRRTGYIFVYYDELENENIAEYAKVGGGITYETVKIYFSKKKRVTSIERY